MARRYEFYFEWSVLLTIFLSNTEHKLYCKFLQIGGRNFFNFRISSSLARNSLNNYKLNEVLFFVLALSCFSEKDFTSASENFTNLSPVKYSCLHNKAVYLYFSRIVMLKLKRRVRETL